jgi:1,4-alpha-glucan branching enzyme
MLVGYVEVALADQDFSLGSPQSRKLEDGNYEVTFRYRPSAGTKSVYLAGDFIEWKPSELKMEGPDSSGHFTLKKTLPTGHHEYKYVLEGKTWRHDPGNRVQTGMYHNSVIELATATRKSQAPNWYARERAGMASSPGS